MSHDLSLKRGVFEGAVIIVSVLLALAADAWWDGRRAEEFEAYVLAALAEEVSDNQAALERDRQTILTQLQRNAFFLQSDPVTLAGLPQDSVEPLVAATRGYVTFDALTDASELLVQATLLSRSGLEARAVASRWLSQLEDSEEEKERFRERADRVSLLVAPYYAMRTAQGPMVTVPQRLASLGPSVLGELRSDSSIVEAVMLRAGIEQTYLNNLEIPREVLDSLNATLARM